MTIKERRNIDPLNKGTARECAFCTIRGGPFIYCIILIIDPASSVRTAAWCLNACGRNVRGCGVWTGKLWIYKS